MTDEHNKRIVTEHGVFILAGSTSHIESFAAHPHSDEAKAGEYDIEGIWILPNGTVKAVYNSGCTGISNILPFESFGTGRSYALAAHDFDTDTRECIEYATRRDSSTGGRINVVPIENLIKLCSIGTDALD